MYGVQSHYTGNTSCYVSINPCWLAASAISIQICYQYVWILLFTLWYAEFYYVFPPGCITRSISSAGIISFPRKVQGIKNNDQSLSRDNVRKVIYIGMERRM